MFTKSILEFQLPRTLLIPDIVSEGDQREGEKRVPQVESRDLTEMTAKIDLANSVARTGKAKEFQFRIASQETPPLLMADLQTNLDAGYMIPKKPSNDLMQGFNKGPFANLGVNLGIQAQPSEKPKVSEYTVKPGESLSGLARAYGMSMADVQRLNPDITDINKIKVGQVIKFTGEKKENIPTVARIKPAKTVEQAQAAPAVREKPKTIQEEMAQAKAELLQAGEIVNVVAKSGDAKTLEQYQAQLQVKTERVASLQSQIDAQEQVAKALEQYNKLSPNEKILKEYQLALQSAQKAYTSLPLNRPDQINPTERAKIVGQIGELRTQIATCETLVKNDKKIAELNADIAKKAAYLKQTGEFAYKTELQGEIAKINASNVTLVASLNNGTIKPDVLMAARSNRGNAKA